VSVERLHTTESATSVRLRDGETEIVDGPFAVTKEALAGGFTVPGGAPSHSMSRMNRM
jgi:hypothetical protein